MFVIIEWNGVGADGILGLVTDTEGAVKIWDSEVSAHNWATKNCAFHYKIVKL